MSNTRVKKRRRVKRTSPVLAMALTGNSKTGPCAITYAAQGSCPVTCVLQGHGCYAETGPMGIITAGLNSAAVGMTPDTIAVYEAEAIDRLPGNTDLRLHGVGDCRTNWAANWVAEACERYMRRSGVGVDAWTYTHAYHMVNRENWGKVSVLASCHSFDECEVAMARGYAACVIVEKFASGDKAWTEDTLAGAIAVVPCPFQTRGVQCVKCRLCMDDARLYDSRTVIAFEAHGRGRASVIKSLPVVM